MIFLWILSLTLFLLGLYFLLSEVFRFPSARSARLTRRFAGKKSSSRLTEKILSRLRGKIRLPGRLHDKLALGLALRETGTDPDADGCLISALIRGLAAALAVLSLGLMSPWAILFSPVVGFLFFLLSLASPYRAAEKYLGSLLREVPALVLFIENRRKMGGGVYRILSSYLPYAGKAMKREISVVLSEMSSGDEEKALVLWERRISSPRVSSLCRSLVALSRGEDTESFWKELSERMAEEEKAMREKEAGRLPRSLHRLSLCLLGVFLMTFLSVILFQIIGTLGVMFG